MDKPTQMDLIRSGVDEEKASRAIMSVTKLEIEKQKKLENWHNDIPEDGKLLISKIFERFGTDLDDPDKDINTIGLTRAAKDIFEIVRTVAGEPSKMSVTADVTDLLLGREDVISALKKVKQQEK